MVSLCQDLFGENHIAARQCLIDLSLLLVGHSRRCLDHPRPGKIANDNPGFGRIMTDLNSLIVFAHVVEANSFSGAARILKMPPHRGVGGSAWDASDRTFHAETA